MCIFTGFLITGSSKIGKKENGTRRKERPIVNPSDEDHQNKSAINFNKPISWKPSKMEIYMMQLNAPKYNKNKEIDTTV